MTTHHYVKAWDIEAYTYQADLYCPGCTAELVTAKCCEMYPTWGFPNRTTHETVEDYLGRMFGLMNLDGNRDDEATFDSGDFPKVVFASQLETVEHCGRCGGTL